MEPLNSNLDSLESRLSTVLARSPIFSEMDSISEFCSLFISYKLITSSSRSVMETSLSFTVTQRSPISTCRSNMEEFRVASSASRSATFRIIF